MSTVGCYANNPHSFRFADELNNTWVARYKGTWFNSE